MKRTFRHLILFSLLAVFVMGSSLTVSAANGTIGKDKAKKIALNEAGVKASSVKKWVKVKLDYDDGGREWDIEFQTSNYKYEVEINARTGRVKDFEMKKIKKNKGKAITEEKAKKIALKTVGVKASSVKKWTKLKFDGKEWEFKFKTNNYEYEVEINAYTGRVEGVEKEKIHKDSAKYIGVEKAKSIALKHAKKRMDIVGKVRYTKAKLDKEYGVAYYEIEFKNNGVEYEYEINAKTGKILEWDIDEDD